MYCIKMSRLNTKLSQYGLSSFQGARKSAYYRAIDLLPLSNSNASMREPIPQSAIPRSPLRHQFVSLTRASHSIAYQQCNSDQTDFSLTMTSLLAKRAKDKNFIFSPLSLHITLSLAAAGSEGKSLNEILSLLGSESSEALNSYYSKLVDQLLNMKRGPQFSFANGVWIDKSFTTKPFCKEIVETVYKAAVKQVDFRRSEAGDIENEVGAWAEEETNGLVKDAVPVGSVNNWTRLILANAIYFQGVWKEKFNPARTMDHDFHLLNGSTIHVPFMTSLKKQYISAFDGFKVLKLPYKQGDFHDPEFSMYLSLPDTKVGRADLEAKVTSEPGFLDHHLPYQRVEVGDFLIPKIKFSFSLEASRVLKELGVASPFHDGEGVFTKMVDNSDEDEKLYVSNVFHKSYIEVYEKATEAAAVTVVMSRESCFMPRTRSIDFIADHPFMFLIRDDGMETWCLLGMC